MKKVLILLAVVCGISGCRLNGSSDPQTSTGTAGDETHVSEVPAEVAEDRKDVISGEMILECPGDKVCIAVMPTEISMEGGDYRYIICPESENSKEVFERVVASADITGGLQEGDESQGIWVLYQDDWWCLLRSGALVGNGRIEAEDGEALWTLCLETARAAGLSEAVRPEELAGIESARLEWDGTTMLTDAASLKKIEGWLSSSEELYGGAKCPFGAKLILQMKNGKEVTLSMATDSCGIWLSEGVYYQYAGGNEAFFDLFLQAGQ